MPESHVLGQCCLIKFWNMKGDSSFFYFPYQQLVAFSSLSAFIALLVNRLILVLNKRNLFNVCLVLSRKGFKEGCMKNWKGDKFRL